MNRNFIRAWAWGSVLLVLGCTRWESYQLPTTPTPLLPPSVRVAALGRASIVLVGPFERGDTLYGRYRGDTLRIARNAIERVERPRVDALRTGVSVIGGVAGWIALGLLSGGAE